VNRHVTTLVPQMSVTARRAAVMTPAWKASDLSQVTTVQPRGNRVVGGLERHDEG